MQLIGQTRLVSCHCKNLAAHLIGCKNRFVQQVFQPFDISPFSLLCLVVTFTLFWLGTKMLGWYVYILKSCTNFLIFDKLKKPKNRLKQHTKSLFLLKPTLRSIEFNYQRANFWFPGSPWYYLPVTNQPKWHVTCACSNKRN